MTEEELLKLNNKVKASHTLKQKENGIGLVNVNERLKLFYGNEYGIKISSVKGEYTKVEVILPCINLNEGIINDA
jgi:two-component system sensor histidine kinase YesM